MNKNIPNIPNMPRAYFGEYSVKTQKNTPRKWTNKEIKWCLELKEQGFTNSEIAKSCKRTELSVSLKLKRMSKINDNYNISHIQEKYDINKEFFELIAPETVLDVYCGCKSYWKNNYKDTNVTTNDKDKSIVADYHLEALTFMCKMYSDGNKYDIIDLDPFGSAYSSFELAIQMAKKGLIVTLGEVGHKRFKRLDYVGKMYNILTLEDFTSDNIIQYIIKTGLKFKKKLKVYKKCDWSGISRVWFEISEHKNDSTWKGDN